MVFTRRWTGKTPKSVAKLLARADGICHLRIYKEKFTRHPTASEVDDLSLGSMNDPDEFGLGHIPLREESFLSWQPVLIKTPPVSLEELDDYTMWKEAGGAFWI